jgi:hypothetical protein
VLTAVDWSVDLRKVDWSKVRRFYWITWIFGLTFGTRLMERGEAGAQKEYSGLHSEID